MKIMYHATEMKNLSSIVDNGLKPLNAEKLIYMTEQKIDALKFLVIRGCKDILVLKIKIYKKDEHKIVETFDHSYNFFKCRAFGYNGEISPDNIMEYTEHKL